MQRSDKNITARIDSLIPQNDPEIASLRDEDKIIIEGNLFESSNISDLFLKSLFRCLSSAVWEYQTKPHKYARTRLEGAKHNVKHFCKYLMTVEITPPQYVFVVKNFESYRVNVDGVVPQSSGAKAILDFLKDGQSFTKTVNPSDLIKITSIVKYTSLSKNTDPTQDTLTGWIESMPWLQKFVEPNIYKRCASPKRLIGNFTEVIAHAMLEIDKVTASLYRILETEIFEKEELCGEKRRHGEPPYVAWLCKTIFLSKFDEWDQIEELRQLFLDDNIKHFLHDEVRQLGERGLFEKRLKSECFKNNLGGYVWKAPFLLDQTFINLIVQAKIDGATEQPNSGIEEYAFKVLMAWQAVQSTDIPKLKQDNVLKIRSPKGTAGIQIDYYKGRAKTDHPTDIVAHTTPQGKALIRFLEKRAAQYTDHDFILCYQETKNKLYTLMYRNKVYQFWALILGTNIGKHVENSLRHSKFTNIIMPVMRAIFEHASPSPKNWLKANEKEGLTLADYRATVKHPIPFYFFAFSHIKNSSVHSRSDLYRDSHLLNYNSHTSATELSDYLTEANKDWVNRLGRLTRLVMDEVIKNSYQLNFDALQNDVTSRIIDLESRLEIKVPKDSVPFYTKDLSDETLDAENPDAVVFMDSPEAVVNILHYLAQAEQKYKSLLQLSPTFVERELLPKCEILETVLVSRMSRKSLDMGRKYYQQYKNKLPSLFDSQLKGE